MSAAYITLFGSSQRGTMVHYAGFWKPNRTRLIAQLWDFIETSSFREDIKGIKDIKYNDNDYKDIAVKTIIMAY